MVQMKIADVAVLRCCGVKSSLLYILTLQNKSENNSKKIWFAL